MLVELYRPVDLAVASVALLVTARLGLMRWPFAGPGLLDASLSVSDLLLASALLGVWYAAFVAAELYEVRHLRRWRDELQRIVAGTLPGTALLLVVVAMGGLSRSLDAAELASVSAFWMLAFTGTLLGRGLLRWLVPVRSHAGSNRVLIVGSGPRAERVLRALTDPPNGHEVIGFVDSTSQMASRDVRSRIIGRLEDLDALLMRNVVDEVVVALPVKSHYAQIQKAIRTCERAGTDVRIPADVFETSHTATEVEDSDSLDSVSLRAVSGDYRRHIKWTIDLAGAAIALVLLAPLWLVIAVVIKLHDGGPVFFIQERHGLHRRVFRMFKFRTMIRGAELLQAGLEDHNEASGAVFKIRADPRVTRVGAFLRRTSLDELPQLLNVLAGHMSLVGPRPLPIRDVDHIARVTPMRRFSVRPGMTGLWQVSGRSELSFDEQIALDLQYIDTWSLWLDARILLRTIGAVLDGRGAV